MTLEFMIDDLKKALKAELGAVEISREGTLAMIAVLEKASKKEKVIEMRAQAFSMVSQRPGARDASVADLIKMADELFEWLQK